MLIRNRSTAAVSLLQLAILEVATQCLRCIGQHFRSQFAQRGQQVRHERHFFESNSTYTAIQRLAQPKNTVIYVGLGGTIDRTNLDWVSLVAKLYSRFGLDEVAARKFVAANGPTASATALEALYLAQATSEKNAYREIADDIRSHLYRGGRGFMEGRLLRSLAAYSCEIAAKGFSVEFVTPNYDEYLLIDLQSRISVFKRSYPDAPVELLKPFHSYPGHAPDRQDARQAGKISCTYIHGFVPQFKTAVGIPVLGEVSYNQSSTQTGEILDKMFRDDRASRR